MEKRVPRKLTDEEIRDIVESIPVIRSADIISGISARESLMKNLMLQLTKIKILPEAIPELKEKIIKKFERAIAEPGTAVGSLAADGFSAQTTQLNFNIFHSAGSTSNVESGFDRINNLLNASKVVKNPSCTVFFNRDVSVSEVLRDIRPEIVNVTIGSLVADFSLDRVEDIIPEKPSWYKIYEKLFEVPSFVKKSKYMIRLHLDKFKLYKHKLTMENVVSALNDQETVYAIFSPISIGIIDIYPDENEIRSNVENQDLVLREDYSYFFLSTITLPSLDKIEIKGISKIIDLIPETYPIVKVISDEIQQEDGSWILHLNRIQMRTTGLKVERVENFLKLLNFTILPVNESFKERYIHIGKFPPPSAKNIENFPSSPIKYISKVIDEEKEKVENELDKLRNEGVIVKVTNKILDASSFVYAITIGSNFLELVTHESVDPNHTITNSLHEINETLGIEASRNFLLREFNYIFEINSAFVSPRHISLIADYMTYKGIFLSVTFSGINKQSVGVLDIATLERSMLVFQDAAAFGKKSSVKGVSSSLFIGSTPNIGTGVVKVLPSQENLKPEKTERVKTTITEVNTIKHSKITKLPTLPNSPVVTNLPVVPKRLKKTTKIISNIPVSPEPVEEIKINNQVVEEIPTSDKSELNINVDEGEEKIILKRKSEARKASLKKFLARNK